MRTLLMLFVFGALIGNLFNSFHAFSGTIPVTPTHLNPLLDWSSYLLFGFAGVFIGLATIVFDKLRKDAPASNWPRAISACVLLGVFYFISACMFLSNNVISIILILGFLLSMWLYDRSVFALIAAFIVAIAGTAVEITLIDFKVYHYARPQVMGVAWWLPFLYGIGSIATSQLVRVLNPQKLPAATI
jgi:hypothetical protein